MRRNILAVTLTVCAALLLAGCERENDMTGKPIGFSAIVSGDADGTRSDMPETRVVYGNVTSNKQPLEWQTDDRITISCAQCEDKQTSNYKVTQVETLKENLDSYAGIVNAESDGIGLRWGTGSHTFYAVYPKADGIATTIAGNVVTGSIPAVQGYGSISGNDGEDKVVAPDMNNMYMVSKAGTYEPESDDVTLEFKPVSTAVEFTITNKFDDTRSAMNVSSVSLVSAGNALNGGFNVDMDDSSGRYGRPKTILTGTVTDAAKTVTISFDEAVSVAYGKTLNFTFFLNPGNTTEVNDLTFVINGTNAGNSETFTRRAKIENSSKVGVTIPTHKKTRISGLMVPEGVIWVTYGTYVTSWDSEVEQDLELIAPEYVLNVIPEISIVPHTGGDISFSVESYYKNGNSSVTPMPWTLEYYDESNSIWTTLDASSVPATLFDGSHTFSSFGGSGVSSAGSTESVSASVIAGTSQTRTVDVSEHNAILRGAQAVGTMTSPYDLSMHNVNGEARAAGAPVTANCYVVHAPGWYCLPLVYGNSYNGSTTPNVQAYAPSATTNKSTYLTPFRNAVGTIDPNCGGIIETDCGVTLTSVSVQWEDCPAEGTNTMVGNADVINAPAGAPLNCKYMRFYISPAEIRQGNIILKVTDGTTTYWSWHIWVTDESISTVPVRYGNNDATTLDMMTLLLGWCDNSTSTINEISGGNLRIRVRQTSDREPIRTDEIVITRNALIKSLSSSDGNAPYYQWGRKDPMRPAINSSSPVTKPILGTYNSIDKSATAGTHDIAFSIQNPGTFVGDNTVGDGRWYKENWGTGNANATYNNLWDANATSNTDLNPVKTIYDPCPPEFKVPRKNAFNYMSTSNVIGSFNVGYNFKKTSSDTEGLFFYAAGYRNHANGGLASMGTYGHYWTACSGDASDGTAFRFWNGTIQKTQGLQQCNGYSIRPVQE